MSTSAREDRRVSDDGQMNRVEVAREASGKWPKGRPNGQSRGQLAISAAFVVINSGS